MRGVAGLGGGRTDGVAQRGLRARRGVGAEREGILPGSLEDASRRQRASSSRISSKPFDFLYALSFSSWRNKCIWRFASASFSHC